MGLRHVAGVVAAVALLGCPPPRYTYAPVGVTNADLAGAPAAVYEIPPGSPRGDARLSMVGIATLKPGGLADSTLRAIHVALAVSNRSDERWTVEASEARLVLSSRRAYDAIEATTATVARPATVDVPARSTRMIDLYFPLPIRLQGESEIPSFEVFWTVHLGPNAITQRTPFQRFAEEPSPRGDDLVPDDFHESDNPLPGSEPPDRRHLLPRDDD
ncbi:MAG TPA: hypothetical protein VLT33_04570 [Labilithrix sp.]|nr:hypothetical protein [Labilithrix sp.]